MTVMYLHPSSGTNLGDRITLQGSIYLINKTVGDHEIIIADLDKYESNPENILIDFQDKKIDIFVLSGTPWLWKGSCNSKKYIVLEKFLELFQNSNTKKIAMGIGSCYGLDSNLFENYIRVDEEIFTKISNIWKSFDLVITRDILAKEALNYFEVEAHNEICTSSHLKKYLNLDVNNKSLDKAIIFYDASKGIASSVLDKFFQESYLNFQFDFIERYNPKVYIIEENDAEILDTKNIPYIHLKSIDNLVLELSTFKTILSGRIHSAIPARMYGVKTFILPVDTRYLTTIPLDVIVLNPLFGPYYNYDKIENIGLDCDQVSKESEERIVKLIHNLLIIK